MSEKREDNAQDKGDRMLDRVASALYDHAVREMRADAGKVTIPIAKIRSVLEEARDGTDRSCAILIFALVDDLFVHFYRAYLNPGVKGGLDALFDGFGPLSTGNSRITVAAALFWIDKSTYSDLNLLRRIRNCFAHQTEISRFEHSTIRGLVSSLTPREKPILATLPNPEAYSLSDRDTFLVRAASLIASMISELALYRHAQIRRVSPHSLDWDALPDNLKEVYRASSGFVLKVLQLEGTVDQLGVEPTQV